MSERRSSALCGSGLGRGPSRRLCDGRGRNGARQTPGARQRGRDRRAPWARRRARRRGRSGGRRHRDRPWSGRRGHLLAAGYEVYAINPMASARYRDRHATSGAKSDPGDAKVLADLVRTDRHNHRPIAGDSELAEGVKLLARAHQNAIWGRQRQLNALRSALREYYPGALAAFGTDLASSDALAVLAIAPTPELGRGLSRSKIASALRRGGRQRNVERRAEEIQTALRAEQLEAPAADRQGPRAHHPLGPGAHRQRSTPRSPSSRRRCRSILSSTRTPRSSSPCQDSGRSSALGCWASSVMTGLVSPVPSLARTTPARRLSPRPRATAKVVWPASPGTVASAMPATSGPSARSPDSPGARRYYDQLRARGKTHRQALRQLANRLVGILHVCLERGRPLRRDWSPGRSESELAA